jgi:hypothetical protein
MGKRFKIGDHVTWNSVAGHVSGKIIQVHTKDSDYKGICTTPARGTARDQEEQDRP